MNVIQGKDVAKWKDKNKTIQGHALAVCGFAVNMYFCAALLANIYSC